MKKRKTIVIMLAVLLAIALAACTPSTPAPSGSSPTPGETLSPDMSALPSLPRSGDVPPGGASSGTDANGESADAMGQHADEATQSASARAIAEMAVTQPDTNKATVIRSGDMCLVGIVVAAQADATKACRQVEEIMRAKDPSIQVCAVTADPDLLLRIKSLAEEISSGRIISNWMQELDNLIAKILAPQEENGG